MNKNAIIMILLMGIISLSGTTLTAAESALPDIAKADWLLLGTFETSDADSWGDVAAFQTDYLTEIGGEAGARPQKGQQTAGKTWTKASQAMPIDLLAAFGRQENCVAYAYLEFESASEQQAALKLGSDDGIRVWLNGELLLSHHAARAINADDEALIVTLQPGVNRLLLKISQLGGDWGFAARFRSLEEEQQDWANAAGRNIAARPLDQVVLKPETFFCTPMTTPAFAVAEPVDLTIKDLQGNVLASAAGQTGKPSALPLPGDFAGTAILQINGKDALAHAVSEQTIFFGDPAAASKKLIEDARKLFEKTSDLEFADDLRATIGFYADVLEGNVHESLKSAARRLAGIETLSRLIALVDANTWNADAFKGVHHWAYRSQIDDSFQPYSLYVPQNYDASKAYGLIVALHWYTGDDLSSMSTLAMAKLQPDDMIVVTPFGRGDMGYLSTSEQDVLDVMAMTQERFHIDQDRVYLVGWSMGGFGTWRVGQHWAEKFAAIAPFDGWSGTEFLDNLRNVATLVVHGNADATVPVQHDREAVKYLQELGYTVRYDELPGVNHTGWNNWVLQAPDELEARLLNYFRQYKRDPFPEEVVLKTNYPRYGKQYWVRLIEVANPPQPGLIKAKRTDAAHIAVQTEGVTVFTLNLNQPQLQQGAVLEVTIDKTTLKVEPQNGEAWFRLQDGAWVLTQDDRTPGVIAHDGGGLADMFTRPVLIVYGTQQRKEILQQAAEILATKWAPTPQIPIGAKIGAFRRKADVDVTEEDMKHYHLLLIGTPEENSVTAKLTDVLPMKFSGSDIIVDGKTFSNIGCAITMPNPQYPSRLVGVLTLPFSDGDIQGMLPYAPLQFFGYDIHPYSSAPRAFPDVVLFGSLDFRNEPVWSGWFDYRWQQVRRSQ